VTTPPHLPPSAIKCHVLRTLSLRMPLWTGQQGFVLLDETKRWSRGIGPPKVGDFAFGIFVVPHFLDQPVAIPSPIPHLLVRNTFLCLPPCLCCSGALLQLSLVSPIIYRHATTAPHALTDCKDTRVDHLSFDLPPLWTVSHVENERDGAILLSLPSGVCLCPHPC
jgi:hypothetical protein